MSNNTIKLNELPEGEHAMKIINADKWQMKDRNIGGLGLMLSGSKGGGVYRTSFVYFETNPPKLLEDSFGYKQLIEKFLPVFGLSYTDIKGTNFNKEMFKDKWITIKMIPTKKDPSKTWAAEFKPYSEQPVQESMLDEEPPWEDDIPF